MIGQAPSGPADLILTAAKLWDGRDLEGRDSIAVSGRRILATGPQAEMSRLATARTRIVNVGSRRVAPGLIDSHLHLVRGGLNWNRVISWTGVASLSDALELVARDVRNRDPMEWAAVVGGWHPNQFAEGRAPTRFDLDEVAPRHPVFAQRNYVEAFLNTRALEEMGWMEAGQGVMLEVDADTEEPSGRVSGAEALQALRSKLSTPGIETQVAGTRSFLRELNRFGLTGAIDAGGFGMTPDSYRPFFETWQREDRGFRTRLLVGPATPGYEVEEMERWMAHVHPGFGDDYLRYLGAGEVLLYRAHDMEGLDRRDVSGATRELSEMSHRLAARGWPMHAHAILDRSVGSILDAWERLDKSETVSRLRYTVTHAEGIGIENLRRARDLGIGMTVQNGMAFRGRDSIATWGEAAVASAPPLRTMLEMGIPLGAGTDGTVVSSYNPWLCIWWMVSGQSVDGSPPRDEDQCLSRDEALRLYTSGSAWFSFEEDDRGNLRPGSFADLVVLSEDPLTVPERKIPSIEADLTIVGGDVVHASRSMAVSSRDWSEKP